ncbi:hypothetical protein PG995_003787 [Apiospora arundinis]
MEPPAKRLKVGQPPLHDDRHNEANDDELSLHPGEFDARQDPLYELDKSRAKAAFKLKSRFESIFDKYEHDFEGEGDEINLHTGEVIINNGHLLSLEDEKDKEDLSADEEEEERILQGKNPPPTSTSLTSGIPAPYNAASQLQNNWAQSPISNGAFPSFSGLSTPAQSYGMPPPFAAFSPAPIDPLWQTPELQMGGPQGHLGLFANTYLGQMNPFQGGYGGGIGRLLNRRAPRRIATAKELEVRNRQDAFLGEELVEDEENDGSKDHDDVEDGDEDGLLGVSKENSRPKQSPDSSTQKPQKYIPKPPATILEERLPRNDTISKSESTTTGNVRSGSHRLPAVSDVTRMGNATSVGSSVSQLQQEHSALSNGKIEHSTARENGQIPEKRSSFIIELRSARGGDKSQKQLIAKKIRKEDPLQEKDIDGGSQGRRPGRPRTKPEFHGNTSRLKMRRPKADLETMLDSNPNEEGQTRSQEPKEMPDTDIAITDTPNGTESLIERPFLDEIEEPQPSDFGNKAFIEAAESIFLSRFGHDTESRGEGEAHEPTPNISSEVQAQPRVENEQAKPTPQPESFSRNQIDPSYNFSDDEDEVGIAESSGLRREARAAPRTSTEPEGEGYASSNRTSGITATLKNEEITELPTNQDEEMPSVESPSIATAVETSEFSRIPPSEGDIAETTNTVAQEIGEEQGDAGAASPEILKTRSANADSTASRRASNSVEEQVPSALTEPPEARHDSSPPPWTPSHRRHHCHLGQYPSHENPSWRGEDEKKRTRQSTTSESNRLTSSAKKHALASLIPDNSDDEDEISILAHTPTSSRYGDAPSPASSPLRNTIEPFTPSHRPRNRSSLGSAAAQSGSRYAPATESRALGLGGHSSSSASRRKSRANYRSTTTKATAFSSPLLQRVLKTPRTGRRYHNPGDEEDGLVRTPGGTMRRCGVDGMSMYTFRDSPAA